MISQRELLNSIRDIEQSASTHQQCQKLADLYIIYDHLYGLKEAAHSYQAPKSQGEILPAYFGYVDAKQAYQVGDVPKEKVLRSLDSLIYELKELIREIYRSTEMPEERERLKNLSEQFKI